MTPSRPSDFVPGPVWVRPEVLAAAATQPLPHRGPEFREVIARVHRGLSSLLETGSPVFPVHASGTGALEAALGWIGRRRVLVANNGSFAGRLATTARALGKEVEELGVPPGHPVEPELVERALAAGRFDAVCVVHSETSTGALSEVYGIAEVVARRPDTALLVDAMSALGAVRIEFDRLGPLAVLVSAVGKALACPPGMAIAAVAPAAAARGRTEGGPVFTLELSRLLDAHARDEVTQTPVSGLWHALDVQLPAILAEGMAARETRHRAMAERAGAWAEDRLGVFPRPGSRSPSLTVVENTRALDVKALRARLARRGFRIADGYGALAGATFRIGHMGDLRPADLDPLLAALDEELREL